MLPPPRPRIAGIAACAQRSAPFRSVSRTASIVSSSWSSNSVVHRHGRVRDHHVEAAERRARAARRPRDVDRRRADVPDRGQRRSACVRDCGNGLVEPVGRKVVRDDGGSRRARARPRTRGRSPSLPR